MRCSRLLSWVLWSSLGAGLAAAEPAAVVAEFHAALGSGEEERVVAFLGRTGVAAVGRELAEDVRLNCIAVRSLHIAPAEIDGDTARVQTVARVVRTSRARGRAAEGAAEEMERRRFELRLEDGSWKIEAIPLAEDLLIDRIVEDPPGTREQVARSPELIGPRLVAQLVKRAVALGSAGDYPRPVRRLSDLAYDIAAAIDDRGGMALALAAQVEDEQRVPNTDKSGLRPKARLALTLAEEAGSEDAIAYASAMLANDYAQEDFGSREAERFYRHGLRYRDSLTPGRVMQLLTGLGLALLGREDFTSAYQVFTDGLAVAERERIDAAIAFNEVHLGGILERQGDYELAAERFRRATQFQGRKPFTIMAHLGMARANFMLGRREAAERDAAGALEIAQATPYKGLISRCHVLLAELQVARGAIAEAEKTLQKAVAYAREVIYPIAETEALLTLGNIQLRTGRYSEAIQTAQDAEAAWAGRGFTDADRYAVLMLMGRAEIALGREERAIAHLTEAIEAAETVRGAVAGSERQRLLFTESYHGAYTEMVHLMAKRGQAEEALRYAERGKGRVLLDALGRMPGEAEELLTTHDREARARLLRQLREANRRSIELRAKKNADRARLAAEIAKLHEAQLALDRFDSDLEARNPRLGPMRGKPAPVTAGALRELLPGRELAILEYIVHETSTTLFVIRNDGSALIETHRIDIPRAELQARVDEYAAQLEAQSLRYRKGSRELYDLLVAPAAARLNGARVLCIVPDGVLWKLPFESLTDSGEKFLVERAAFFYVPSISAYRAIVSRPRVGSSGPPLVAFGNPTIGEVRGRVAAVYRDADLGPLPEAEIEARTIAGVWGGESAAYTRAEAREDVAKREMERARIVHFATHGLFDDGNPMYSQVLLAPHAAASEDGALQAWELMRLDLAADLVVLSGCETARGRVGAGEGLIGMSWALFVGGCPSTVAARWKIDSARTTELMVQFHRALSSNGSRSPFRKAEALRRAQLALIRERMTRHPFYWASFELIGAPR